MNMETTRLKNKKENWLFWKTCETKNTKFHPESEAVRWLPYSISDCDTAGCSVESTAYVMSPTFSLSLLTLALTFNQSLPWKWGTSIPAPSPHASQAPWRENSHPKMHRLMVCSYWQWWTLPLNHKAPSTVKLAQLSGHHPFAGPDHCTNKIHWDKQQSVPLSLDERIQAKSDTRHFPMK